MRVHLAKDMLHDGARNFSDNGYAVSGGKS
jgi:hypothetical protein